MTTPHTDAYGANPWTSNTISPAKPAAFDATESSAAIGTGEPW